MAANDTLFRFADSSSGDDFVDDVVETSGGDFVDNELQTSGGEGDEIVTESVHKIRASKDILLNSFSLLVVVASTAFSVCKYKFLCRSVFVCSLHKLSFHLQFADFLKNINKLKSLAK